MLYMVAICSEISELGFRPPGEKFATVWRDYGRINPHDYRIMVSEIVNYTLVALKFTSDAIFTKGFKVDVVLLNALKGNYLYIWP